jgi:RHS repeat-associated protein
MTRSGQYDTLGRTTVVALPNNQTVSYSFSGSTVTVTDQVGRKKQQQYDALGRLITVTEQDTSTGQLTLTTSYTYDLLDDLTQVNQGGQIRAFKYDAAKRKLYERLPEQTATINDGTGTMWSCAYTYTNFDAVATRTDARGAVATWAYDNLNRLISVSYDLSHAPGVAGCNNVLYTYDTSATSTTKGMLLSISMTGPLPPYQETFSYDTLNRVSSRTVSMDGQSYTVRYQHNNINQLTQLTYPSGRVVATNHDNSGRLSSLTEPTNPSTGAGGTYMSNLTYNAAGKVTGDTLSPWISEAYSYDPQTLQYTAQTASASGGQTGGLMSLNYSYQAAAGQMGVNTTAGNTGRLVAINNNSTINGAAESAAYSYDLQGRLVTSSQTTNGSAAQRLFAYDLWGNRTSMWDAISGANQLQSITLQQSGGAPTNQIQSVTAGATMNYTYDAAGNVTSDGVHSYQYDAESRIKSVDSAATGSYRYDYRNRRIKGTSGAAAIHYIWNGGRVLAEHNMSTGAQIVDYVYAGGKLIGEGSGSQLGANGPFTFLLRDRLETRLSVGRFGGVLGQQGHLPFGEEFGESGAQEKHHFTTYESDAETGTDYAVNRQHGQAIGRFMQIDPKSGSLAEPQSLNRYTYASNNPVNLWDPSGLQSDDPSEKDQCEDGDVKELIGPFFLCATLLDSGGSPITIGGPAAAPSGFLAQLARALMSMSNKCKDQLGGDANVTEIAGQLNSMTNPLNLTIAPYTSTDKITNGWKTGLLGLGGRITINDYWTTRTNQQFPPAATTVVNSDSGGHIDAQTNMTIILGPAFFDPADLDAKGLMNVGGDVSKYQNDLLVHEYFHLFFNLDDAALASKLNLSGLGYDVIPGSETIALRQYFDNNCEAAKKQ